MGTKHVIDRLGKKSYLELLELLTYEVNHNLKYDKSRWPTQKEKAYKQVRSSICQELTKQ